MNPTWTVRTVYDTGRSTTTKAVFEATALETARRWMRDYRKSGLRVRKTVGKPEWKVYRRRHLLTTVAVEDAA